MPRFSHGIKGEFTAVRNDRTLECRSSSIDATNIIYREEWCPYISDSQEWFQQFTKKYKKKFWEEVHLSSENTIANFTAKMSCRESTVRKNISGKKRSLMVVNFKIEEDPEIEVLIVWSVLYQNVEKGGEHDLRTFVFKKKDLNNFDAKILRVRKKSVCHNTNTGALIEQLDWLEIEHCCPFSPDLALWCVGSEPISCTACFHVKKGMLLCSIPDNITGVIELFLLISDNIREYHQLIHPLHSTPIRIEICSDSKDDFLPPDEIMTELNYYSK